MIVLRSAGEDQFLVPGTRVRLSIMAEEGEDRYLLEPDYGVVVNCWPSREQSDYYCDVAFFGEELPRGKPDEEPYIIRHAARSLASVE